MATKHISSTRQYSRAALATTFLLAGASGQAGIITPAGHGIGDHFRLVFVSGATIAATAAGLNITEPARCRTIRGC